MYKKLVGPYALTRRRKAILAVYQSRQKKSEGFGGEWRRTESKAELIGYYKSARNEIWPASISP